MQEPQPTKKPTRAKPGDKPSAQSVPDPDDYADVEMTCTRALDNVERLCEFAQKGNQSAIRAAWDCALRLAEIVQKIAQTPAADPSPNCLDLQRSARPEIWMPALWAQRTALNSDFGEAAKNIELGTDSLFSAISGKTHLTTPLARFLCPIIVRFHRIHRRIEWRLDHPAGLPAIDAQKPQPSKDASNPKRPSYDKAFQALDLEIISRIIEMIRKFPGQQLNDQTCRQIELALPEYGAVRHWERRFFIISYYLRSLCPMQKSNADIWAAVTVEYIYLNYTNPAEVDGLKEIFRTARKHGRGNVRSYLMDKISDKLAGILSENNPGKPIPPASSTSAKSRQEPACESSFIQFAIRH